MSQSEDSVGRESLSLFDNHLCLRNILCAYYMEIKSGFYTSENRSHIDEYRHDKTACCHGRQCEAFKRLVENGYCQDDILHCAIFFHEGRRGGIAIDENLGSKKFLTGYYFCDFNSPTHFERGFKSLKGDLIKELENNGFGHVMIPTSGPYDSLNDVAREKLTHPRHLQMGSPLSHSEILAIILYTGTGVYAELRVDEMCYSKERVADNDNRSGYYEQKWPVLGHLLESAIKKLNSVDKNNRPSVVYHGLHDIEIDPGTFNNKDMPGNAFKYGTFISTSWDKEVSLCFMAENGCLMEIDTTPKVKKDVFSTHAELIGADVSWISKFPTECEFLIARGQAFLLNFAAFDSQLNCQVAKVQCHQIWTP